ncbi:ADP-ribosylation factor-like protein 2 [Teleopsis dalmanni]|uniref:ADP-ribosylation factor-like protein 2 n=1 Tax=Teleopsis dalmanni TaxID=139649 RepID=UPI0018CE3F5B|nr:ADP-ribosylation factor-like protein 2 [Teleopsis dalmanni]
MKNVILTSAPKEKLIKVVLLGLEGSGKTEIGCALAGTQRLGDDSTNGVQYFRMKLPSVQVSITEIGGNKEMQKIWHHYFDTAMGFIFCFDMSATYEELKDSFEVLQKTFAHPFVSGKPFLLIATKADLADQSVQLYDIENTFQLETLANYYFSSLRLCCYSRNSSNAIVANEIFEGVNWLTAYINKNIIMLRKRVRCDTNMKIWQNQIKKIILEGNSRRGKYERLKKRRRLWATTYRRSKRRIRPCTAPATIFSVCQSTETVELSTSNDLLPLSTQLPNKTNVFLQQQQNGSTVAL